MEHFVCFGAEGSSKCVAKRVYWEIHFFLVAVYFAFFVLVLKNTGRAGGVEEVGGWAFFFFLLSKLKNPILVPPSHPVPILFFPS